jgi:hypothetical protein
MSVSKRGVGNDLQVVGFCIIDHLWIKKTRVELDLIARERDREL